MKNSPPVYALCLYVLFGIALLFQMGSEPANVSWKFLHGEGFFQKQGNGDRLIIFQGTKKATINVMGEELAEAICSGKVKVRCDHPGSSTLIRIVTGKPSNIGGVHKGTGKLPFVESNGEVMVVNKNGIIVGPAAVFEWKK